MPCASTSLSCGWCPENSQCILAVSSEQENYCKVRPVFGIGFWRTFLPRNVFGVDISAFCIETGDCSFIIGRELLQGMSLNVFDIGLPLYVFLVNIA